MTKLWICMLVVASSLLLAQGSKQFVQAGLTKTIKASTAKAGDPVKARVVNTVSLPGGISISEGATLIGQVRSADAKSLSISFEQLEQKGKTIDLKLSIRAAMLPGGPANHVNGVAAETGSVIGMPGVALQVDESPQRASKFQSADRDLQLKSGLQFMLAQPE